MKKLFEYVLKEDIEGILKDREVMMYFDGVVDNNGSIESSLEQVRAFIRKKFGVEV